MPDLPVPIAAITRLSVHARSNGDGRSAICADETLAAVTRTQQDIAKRCFVVWSGKCADCTSGRFRFYDWPDGKTVRCRDWSRTGTGRLRFTETVVLTCGRQEPKEVPPEAKVFEFWWNRRTRSRA